MGEENEKKCHDLRCLLSSECVVNKQIQELEPEISVLICLQEEQLGLQTWLLTLSFYQKKIFNKNLFQSPTRKTRRLPYICCTYMQLIYGIVFLYFFCQCFIVGQSSCVFSCLFCFHHFNRSIPTWKKFYRISFTLVSVTFETEVHKLNNKQMITILQPLKLPDSSVRSVLEALLPS